MSKILRLSTLAMFVALTVLASTGCGQQPDTRLWLSIPDLHAEGAVDISKAVLNLAARVDPGTQIGLSANVDQDSPPITIRPAPIGATLSDRLEFLDRLEAQSL